MIQRIQTVFLILAAAALVALYAFPFASTEEQVATSVFFDDGTFTVDDHPALLGLFGLASVLTLLAVFTFKNRTRQLLMSRLAIVFTIVGLALGFWLVMQDGGNIPENIEPEDQLGAYLPAVFLVFMIAAMYFIRKDEKLVRSMDRLR